MSTVDNNVCSDSKPTSKDCSTQKTNIYYDQKPCYNLFRNPNISNYIIREVKPYIQSFETYTKGRWIGRTLMDILTSEFGGYPKEYWVNGVNKGFIRINGQKSAANYLLKNSDKLAHKAHRHEPMIYGEIQLVGETPELLAVSKPSSIPMHPCGAYRFNSLEYILKYEPLIPNQPQLFLVHRLDRLTSGLIVMAKSKEVAGKISKEIRNKNTEKIYLARVKGKFPSELIHRLKQVEKIDFDSFTEDEQEREREGNSSKKSKRGKKRKTGGDDEEEEQGGEPRGGEELEGNKIVTGPFLRDIQPFDELIQSPQVGFCSKEISSSFSSSSSSEDRYNGFPSLSSTEYWVQCPLTVISYREGIHACASDGRPSLSGFRSLSYDPVTDTSLVECRPYTGRTHQLRLHLQLIGNPIANDPCYGGELFFGDENKRNKAIEAMEKMRKSDHRPLSRIPHFVKYENNTKDNLEQTETNSNTSKGQLLPQLCNPGNDYKEQNRPLSPQMIGEEEDPLIVPFNPEHIHLLPEETDDEYLIRTCK
jgi:23S rRNA-/tRNA-specific pseudouridylate synthase